MMDSREAWYSQWVKVIVEEINLTQQPFGDEILKSYQYGVGAGIGQGIN